MKDLIIVGAGPAGCAAAVMGASLGLTSYLIERGSVGGRLHVIGALENVPGAWATGPELAEALSRDITRLESSGHCEVIEDEVINLAAEADRVCVQLSSGRTLTAGSAIVATGVAPITPLDTDWIAAPSDIELAPLWRTRPDALVGRTCVLGGDRPLGTWLRANPTARRNLMVVHPPLDDYKVEEVRNDQRVQLHRASRAIVSKSSHSAGFVIEVHSTDGERKSYLCDTVLTNMGNHPAGIRGLVAGPDGYFPPDLQPARVVTAGDLRSSRFQRIVTSQGSGAEAALGRYYDMALQTASGR